MLQRTRVLVTLKWSKSWVMCVYRMFTYLKAGCDFFKVWGIQWVFVTQEILIPACLFSVIYAFLEHTTVAEIHLEKRSFDSCAYILTKNDFFTLCWMLCIIETLVTFWGEGEDLLPRIKFYSGSKNESQNNL